MDAAEWTRLRQALHGRREAIAEAWYRALSGAAFMRRGGDDLRRGLLALTERAIAALLAEPFAPAAARALGAALAELHATDPATLRRTRAVLGEQLVAGLPADRVVALLPRLLALLGELAEGFHERADAARKAERAALAAALAERERHLRAVEGAAPVIRFAFDRHGVFTLAEGGGLAALGRRPGAAVGRSVFDRYRDYPEVLANARRALAGEAFTATVEVAGRVLEATLTPERDARGAVVGVLGVALDITERVRAQERLRAREAQLQALAALLRADLAPATGHGRTEPPPAAPPATAAPPTTPPTAAPARADPPAEPLTAREVEVLELVAQGLGSKEIGVRLRIASRTVDKHAENARGKLGVNNRVEAVNRARALGLIAPAPAEPGGG